jgi:hypothetical protein
VLPGQRPLGAGLRCGLEKVEGEKTVASGLGAGIGKPHAPLDERKKSSKGQTIRKRRRTFPNDIVTEDSAALDFAEIYSGELRYDHHAGIWFKWGASHWVREETRLTLEYARRLARKLAEDASEKGRYAARKTSFASGVERLARSDRTFAVTSADWDQDMFSLGTPILAWYPEGYCRSSY